MLVTPFLILLLGSRPSHRRTERWSDAGGSTLMTYSLKSRMRLPPGTVLRVNAGG